MTENYEYVRDSVLASLMMSESVSGHAVYPHRIFEIGKVAYRDDKENSGTSTRQYLGLVSAGGEANFNTLAGQLRTLFYYLSRDYTVEESTDSRFIPGRAAAILYQGRGHRGLWRSPPPGAGKLGTYRALHRRGDRHRSVIGVAMLWTMIR